MKKLQEKVEREFNEFLEEVVSLSKEELSRRAYEIGWKNELCTLVQNDNIESKEVIEVLLSSKNALDTLYSHWLKFDTTGVDDDLSYFSRHFLDKLKD